MSVSIDPFAVFHEMLVYGSVPLFIAATGCLVCVGFFLSVQSGRIDSISGGHPCIVHLVATCIPERLQSGESR